MTPLDPEAVRAAVAAVPDPEIPVVTIEDLGILRDIRVDGADVHVVLTPTYSGCPATHAIENSVRHAVTKAGGHPHIHTRLAPAWTTDLITDSGRDKLRRFGIAPPGRNTGHGGATPGPVDLPLHTRTVACPLCGADDTEEISRFGSTACKALRRCRACGEPFDEFKALT